MKGLRTSTQSPASAASPGSAGKALIEEYLRERIALATVLRPVRFMTNYLGRTPFGIDGISGGVHRHLFPPHEPMQIIALEDIAVAARVYEKAVAHGIGKAADW